MFLIMIFKVRLQIAENIFDFSSAITTDKFRPLPSSQLKTVTVVVSKTIFATPGLVGLGMS